MSYVYLIASVFGIASTSVFGASYNRKNARRKDTAPIYSLVKLTTIFIFWVAMFFVDGAFDWHVLPYSFGFALGFVACTLATVRALNAGPMALTALILQLSLIGVTVWGFIFWDAPFTWVVGIGLCLIVLSLWLCLYAKKREENKITLPWLFWVSVAFVGNAACSIIQKTQQMQYDGKFGNFMMMVATFFSMLFGLIVYLKSDKSDAKIIVKSSWLYPVSAGVMNAIMNLCVMLLATSALSPSLIYPVLAVGSLAVTTMFSAFVFKEKMYWWQWVGILVGAVAVAALSV